MPPILTVEEVAEFLRLNVKTVYDGIKAGDIPAKKIGRRRLVILRDALLRSLGSQPSVPPSGGQNS
ncbi:MAG: helix-turn-helix domain-containing protein [Deltaproteobacteria bacterium]|nr:helix-turn-helix domain-containing protein [Deltaproteobacteria bacterium]